MSWSAQVGPARRSEPVEGGMNIGEGLRNWRQAAAYAKGDRANVGAGGVDVLLLGDSILAGSGATFQPVDKLGNRLRQLLQRRFNPEDVAGGYGFLPVVTHPPTPALLWSTFQSGNMYVNGVDADWELHGLAAAFVGEAGDSKGVCLRHASVASSLAGPSQTAAWFYGKDLRMNHSKQASTAAMNADVKQAQVVYMAAPGRGRFQWIHGNFSAANPPYAGTPPTPPANSFSESVDCDAAEAVGLRSGLSDVASSSAATHYIQVDQLDPGDRVDVEGLLLYADDAARGVRVHDLTCGGAVSSSYNDPLTLAGLARFGTPAGSPAGRNATNAKLAVICLGTNDCDTGATPTVDLAAYRSNLSALVASIQGWASEPSVLLLYPPARDNANAAARWGDYIEAGRSLCNERNIGLLDLWSAAGRPAHGGNAPGGYMFDRGFYHDGVHYTKLAQDWMAQAIFGALSLGI
jgi:hypothetical protein